MTTTTAEAPRSGSAYARNLERELSVAVLDRLDTDPNFDLDLDAETVHEVIAATLDEITARLTASLPVTLRGFGVFEARLTRPTVRFVPGTTEKVQVPAKLRPTFRAARILKRRLNQDVVDEEEGRD